MMTIAKIRKVLRDSLFVQALLAIILAIPVMVFIEHIDESGFGSALFGAAVIIFVLKTINE